MQQAPCPNVNYASCLQCQLGKVCLPVALQNDEINRLDSIVRRGKSLHKGETIYHKDEAFRYIYAIKSGYVKTVQITDSGHEKVVGFHFPGEIFGIEGISQKHYASTAKALVTTSLCAIPFDRLTELTLEFPQLQSQVFQIMGQEIANDQQLIQLLNNTQSEQRIAAFLLIICSRIASRQAIDVAFNLPMTRTDIASYLGLTVETVSRVLSRLTKSGLIELNQRQLRLADINALQELAKINL